MRWKFSSGNEEKLEVSGFRDGRRGGDNQQEAGMVVIGREETGQQSQIKPLPTPKKKSGKKRQNSRMEVGWENTMLGARLEGIILNPFPTLTIPGFYKIPPPRASPEFCSPETRPLGNPLGVFISPSNKDDK